MNGTKELNDCYKLSLDVSISILKLKILMVLKEYCFLFYKTNPRSNVLITYGCVEDVFTYLITGNIKLYIPCVN